MYDWIILIREQDSKTLLYRWVSYRHRAGTKDIASFNTLGALRRFVRHHCLNLAQKVRAFNQRTKETLDIV